MPKRSTHCVAIQRSPFFHPWKLALGWLLLFSIHTSAQVRYVTATGTNPDPTTATSWQTATADLQGAINALAQTGGQVWVAAGTYKPTASTDRSLSFSMRNRVAIYGGFVGTETSPAQRPAIHPTSPSSTTLSGDIGRPGDASDNSYHVFYHPYRTNLNNTALLDGVVITGGNANGSGASSDGGGIYNNNSSPTLSNCTFQANGAARDGGGIYNDNSSPTLIGCTFQANSASSGGGMYSFMNSPTLTECRFQANSAVYSGGGVFNINSSPTLSRCYFQDNQANDGGGMYNRFTSNPRLTDCHFLENSVRNYGAGMANVESAPTLIHCRFEHNLADYYGAGVYNLSSQPRLTGCSFLGNSAAFWGGAMGNNQSTPLLTNCSFQANSAPQGGALYNFNSSLADLINGVLFDNGKENSLVNSGGLGSNSYIRVSYSLLDVPQQNNNYSDLGRNLLNLYSPFVSPTSTQLTSCSPAINAGFNAAPALSGITTDLAGNGRFYNGETVDMGAYEYQGEAHTLAVTNPLVNQAIVGQAFSQQFVANGGLGPYRFGVRLGSVPNGLSLSPAGILAGTPTQAGLHSLVVDVQDAGGCPASSNYDLYVAEPILSLSGLGATSNPVCAGSPVSFTASVGQVTGSYSYTLTGGSESLSGTGNGPVFSQRLLMQDAGSQSVRLIVSHNGQSAEATVWVDVSSPPAVSITSSRATLSCAHPRVNLTASGGASYRWEDASTDPNRTITTAGTYSVTVASGHGCWASDSITVEDHRQVPIVNLEVSGPLSAEQPTVTLTATPVPEATYRFSPGTLPGNQPHIATASSPGIYSVTVTAPNGCTASAQTTVTANTLRAVTGFELMDATTQQVIQPLQDQQVINLATLPTRRVAIRALTSPAIVGSVRLVLTGKQSRTQTDNGAPYALFGDKAGDYNPWTPPVGAYTLTATPFEAAGSTGSAGSPLTVHFQVVDQPQSGGNTPPVLSPLPNQTLTLGQTLSLRLQATDRDVPAQTLRYGVSGPLGVQWDAATGALSWTPTSAGTFSLTVHVTDNGSPALSAQQTISVRVDAAASTPPQVVSVSLMNADNETEINVLFPGEVINLATLVSKNLAIRANTSPATAGSVRLVLGGQQARTQVDNGAPYALFGDKNGNYNAWTPPVGAYSLTVTPFSGPNATGQPGAEYTLNFSVINQSNTVPAVVSYSLMDADQDQEIRVITEGETINLASLPTRNLAILANTSPAVVGSVHMVLGGQQSRTQVDNGAPYALFGDKSGNYNAWTPAVGSYSLTGTTYTGSGATGMAGGSLTISFRVINQASAARVARGETASEASVVVYPNPFRETFTLKSPVQGPLVLYDLSGRKVFELESVQDGQLIEPGTGLASGFYLLQVGKDTRVQRSKLLKVH
ncbi:putative Ig domain-containing protein [Larkinella insperata]|uniref:Ig domain-containing protein n=1 Tax=Larkinella insperata TaxID=332158 RepID=A0ABW3QL87_9BACT